MPKNEDLSPKGEDVAPAPEPKPKAKAATPKPEEEPAAAPEPTPKPKRGNPSALDLQLAKMRQEVAEKAAAERDDRAKNIYVMRCPRDRNHHAVYFTENPVGKVVDDSMWWSLVHELDTPYTDIHIPCQECMVRGEGRRWNVRLRGRFDQNTRRFTFQVPDRHAQRAIFAIPREEALGEELFVARAAADEVLGSVTALETGVQP